MDASLSRTTQPLAAFLRRRYSWFGLAGAAVVVLCSLVSGLAYRGKLGETYSLLNHFISELGEIGVSPLAWLFNLGLFAGGLLFLLFVAGLGLALPGWWARLGALAGAVASLALSGVGLFPMNHLDPHILAAMTYFRSGLVTVLLFGLAIQLQPRGGLVLDRRANLAGLLAAACYAAFLAYMQVMPAQGAAALDPNWQSTRPAVWPLALLEWSIFFSTILWFFVIALAGRGKTNGLR